jgi:hypothetical protein
MKSVLHKSDRGRLPSERYNLYGLWDEFAPTSKDTWRRQRHQCDAVPDICVKVLVTSQVKDIYGQGFGTVQRDSGDPWRPMRLGQAGRDWWTVVNL